MGRLIDMLLRAVTRKGLRRGLGGEHWAWLLIAGAAYVFERARHPNERTERIDLRPGDRYLLTQLPGGGRRRARGRRGHDEPGAADAVAVGTPDAHGPRPATG